MCAVPTNRTHTNAPSAANVTRRRLTPIDIPPAMGEYGLKELPTQGHRAVPAEPLVDKRHDFIERVRLQSLLFRDAPDEAVYTFDVLGSSEQRPCGRRRFAKTLGRLCVFFKRHQISVVSAKTVTQLRDPVIDRA